MAQNSSNIDSLLPRTGLAPLLASLDIAGEIQLPDGSIVPTGGSSNSKKPLFRVIFRSEKALRTPMTELGVGLAFIQGDIDVEGDMQVLLSARSSLQNKYSLRQKLQFLIDWLRTATTMNSAAIEQHYGRGDDFYLSFLDKEFRLYSHGLFQREDESLEDASRRKLETMFSALNLKPGMRLLDIGGGWGAVTQYCGPRGVHVTTVVLAPDQARYIERLIKEISLTGCKVILEDFLKFSVDEPYDYAVSFGAIEHIPQYRRFATKIWDVLKPGGRLYLDGSATVEKFDVSSLTRRLIWTGTHTYMAVPDVMTELLYHGFVVKSVVNDTKDYELTMLEWAKRLEAAKDDVIGGWGEQTYRLFRLFLWGGAHAFRNDTLQAYHLIAERTSKRGPRPSMARRVWLFLKSLF